MHGEYEANVTRGNTNGTVNSAWDISQGAFGKEERGWRIFAFYRMYSFILKLIPKPYTSPTCLFYLETSPQKRQKLSNVAEYYQQLRLENPATTKASWARLTIAEE